MLGASVKNGVVADRELLILPLPLSLSWFQVANAAHTAHLVIAIATTMLNLTSIGVTGIITTQTHILLLTMACHENKLSLSLSSSIARASVCLYRRRRGKSGGQLPDHGSNAHRIHLFHSHRTCKGASRCRECVRECTETLD